MEKCFNIAGPCFPDEHYMLPALERLPGIMRIVEQRTRRLRSRRDEHVDNFYCFRCLEIRGLGVSEEITKSSKPPNLQNSQ